MASIVSLSTATNPVVFPPPPPTTNALTPEQRSQLRKSTKKLGKILGATPHLLDTDIVSILGPVHVQLPPRYDSSLPDFSDFSTDSYTSRSSSSCSYSSHPYSARASLERKISTSSSLSRQTSHRIRPSIDRLDRLNSIDALAPVLRLTLTPPSPTTSSSSSSSSPPSSPTKTSAKFSSLINSHSRSNSLNDNDFFFTTTNSSSDMKFTLRPARHSTSAQSCRDSISDEPSINLPSSTTMTITSTSTSRRQKMDRLRKMLGDEVPVHLVFPDQEQGVADFGKRRDFINEEEDDDSNYDDHRHHRLFGLTPVAVAGTAIPRPKKQKQSTPGKIVATRDSMGAFTPHRAKRQEKQKAEKLTSSAVVSPPSQQQLTRAPSPPIVIPASCLPQEEKPSPKKLCAIVESPEEHGSNPFEGFGFGCPGPKRSSSVVVQSSWHVHNSSIGGGGDSKPEDMNKVWSTRKGYTGWDRSVTTALGKSQEERKRAMSYRKPPPPIDF